METIVGTSRDFLFSEILSKNCICAEIGVDEGINAQRIINISKPEKLYLIDLWGYTNLRNIPEEKRNRLTQGSKISYETVKEKFKNNKNINIIRKLSVEASKQFKDKYFDWVYIDASHDYESVKEDIESWWPKIKFGGFLCGHDYFNEVEMAVNEFCKNNNLKLYYKGNNQPQSADGPSDWSIKK